MLSRRILFLIYILIVICQSVFSNTSQLTENSRVSLLTCTPYTGEIYALFGHTGIRIQDPSLNMDLVFDYGNFDFDSDSFILRFVKGETDYMAKAKYFDHFIFEYTMRQVGVVEQEINLTLAEKQKIFEALQINIKPENRVYRYNFFYDNCATRPRDIIQNNIAGTIDYKTYTQEQSYRDLVEECLIMTPWARFGINLVLGSGADETITERQKDFLPLYLSTAFSKADIITSEGDRKALVKIEEQLLEPEGSALELLVAKEKGLESKDYPLYVGYLLFFLAISLFGFSYLNNIKLPGQIFNTLLFLVAGIAGCIIFFLMFYSEHPCVDANWNLVWLNPLALIVVPFFYVKSFAKYVIFYHFINFAALVVFLLGIPFISQSIDFAFIPYIITLSLCSGWWILEYTKIRRLKDKALL